MSEMQSLLRLVGTDKTPDERAICRAALLSILRGEAIDRTGLMAATGFPGERTEALLEALTMRGLLVLEEESGRVLGSWGLSLVPTDHRLRIRGRELYTWCAMDAVGIPAGLGENASIASHCRECGMPVSIEMVTGQLARVEPVDVQVWMTGGQAGQSVVGFT